MSTRAKKPRVHKPLERRAINVSVSVPYGLVEILDRLADKVGRSRSNYIQWVIREEALRHSKPEVESKGL